MHRKPIHKDTTDTGVRSSTKLEEMGLSLYQDGGALEPT